MPYVPHRRQMVGSFAAGALTALLMAQVAIAGPPSSSGSVERFVDTFGAGYFDEADGLVALGGPPPEEGCFGLGFDDPADVMLVHTGAGPIKALIRQGDTPVFVYDLNLGHPCEIIEAGGTPVPLYVGSMSTILNDNDPDVSLTRANSFGSSSTGWVFDGDGNRCHFSAHVRLQVTREDEFRVLTEGITISC
jgi:hypothetical protein